MTEDTSDVTCSSCLKLASRRREEAETTKTPKTTRFALTIRYVTNVAGVTFKNEDGSERQVIISRCHPGEELDLVRDPENEFDSGAVKVTRLNGDQIGFIPAHMTRDGDPHGLAEKIDSGTKYLCRVAEITGGGADRHYGITIEITDGTWPEPRLTQSTGHIPLWILLAVGIIAGILWAISRQ